MNAEWIATRLMMGHPESMSRMLSAGRADKNLAMKWRSLAETLFPDEEFTQ